MSELMTMEEACGQLGISRAWLNKIIEEGQIKSIKLGGATRIKREELERYMAKSGRLPSNNDGLLTMEQAASKLGVCRRTLEVLIFSGEIPSVVIGRRRFVRQEDLERYIREVR